MITGEKPTLDRHCSGHEQFFPRAEPRMRSDTKELGSPPDRRQLCSHHHLAAWEARVELGADAGTGCSHSVIFMWLVEGLVCCMSLNMSKLEFTQQLSARAVLVRVTMEDGQSY